MNQSTLPRIQRQELPPPMRGRTGYRNAEPHLRRDFDFRCAYFGVHFIETNDGFLQPLTPCGEYHVSTLRLNRAWLWQHRRDRIQKWARLNEAWQLYAELERALEKHPTDNTTQIMQRLLSFLSEEIEALRSELAGAIPMWRDF